LLAQSTGLAASRQAVVADYAQGLAHWRARDFALAATCFHRSAAIDLPALLFHARALELAENPPGEEWEPIRTLQEK
jgi:adenylate cyclase/guanylate cyclase